MGNVIRFTCPILLSKLIPAVDDSVEVELSDHFFFAPFLQAPMWEKVFVVSITYKERK